MVRRGSLVDDLGRLLAMIELDGHDGIFVKASCL